jgi:hypothetical protein
VKYKLFGVTTPAVLVAWTSGAAMKGKFDPQCEIVNNRTIHAHGPVNDWEADELGGLIHARVVQGETAVGASGYLRAGDTRWQATLTADAQAEFTPGEAHAFGVGSVRLTDHSTHERYPWDLDIELI